MRIIMEGDPSKRKKEKVVKCNNCGCEFACTEDEVKVLYGRPYKETIVRCPYCGKLLSLEKARYL